MGLFSSILKIAAPVAASFIPGIGPVAASAIGAIGSGVAGAIGASEQNSAAAEATQKQNDINLQNSNTAHQREVKDLIAAGLNPILSAGGSGAQVSSVSPAPVQNVADSAARMQSSASNINLQSAQKQQIAAGIDNTHSQTALNQILGIKAAADARLSNSAAAQNSLRTATMAADLPAAKVRGAVEGSGLSKGVGYVEKFLEPLTTILHGANSASSTARNLQ